MSYKRKAELPVGDINDLMEVTPLGAGSEVGRSCHVLKYKGKTVLVHTHFSYIWRLFLLIRIKMKKVSTYCHRPCLFTSLFLFFLELFYMFVCPCLNGSCYHTPLVQQTRQLDCGIHPGQSGISGLPFFDEVDPATIDVLLITQ